jgi:tyrosine-protein phosphatase YwqE
MFNWFKREKIKQVGLDVLQLDMHSHLLPGIDDGSRTMDETIAMVNKMADMGYTRIITTPHIMHEVYPNTKEIIEAKLTEVREEIDRLSIPVKISAAAEYYLDYNLMESIKTKQLLTLGDGYVLVEYGFISPPTGSDELIFEMQSKGYKPILAHVERYAYFFNALNEIERLRERGVLLQMNLLSLTGHYGLEVKKQAEKLVDKGWIDFAASDCHRMQHLQLIEKNLSIYYIQKLLGSSLKNKSLLFT